MLQVANIGPLKCVLAQAAIARHQRSGRLVRPTLRSMRRGCSHEFCLAMRVKCAVLVAVVVVAIPCISAAPARAEDHSPVIDVPTTDPEMAAAIARARATLPAFWASYEAPKPSETGHSLKVRFPTSPRNGEHIWMMDVKRLPNGLYSGRSATRRAICRAEKKATWPSSGKPTSRTGCSCATARSSVARP